MNAWDVFRPSAKGRHTINGQRMRQVNTVYFSDDCDGPYIVTSLVNHDGMPSDIVIRNAKTKQVARYR